MATIDSLDIIKELLRNDGVYHGDPQLHSICSYVNQFGNQTYSVCNHAAALESVFESPYTKDVKILWMRGMGLTDHGERVLQL